MLSLAVWKEVKEGGLSPREIVKRIKSLRFTITPGAETMFHQYDFTRGTKLHHEKFVRCLVSSLHPMVQGRVRIPFKQIVAVVQSVAKMNTPDNILHICRALSNEKGLYQCFMIMAPIPCFINSVSCPCVFVIKKEKGKPSIVDAVDCTGITWLSTDEMIFPLKD